MPSLCGFGLLLFRSAGLFLTAPILSSRSVASNIRIALAVATTFAVFTGAGSPQAAVPDNVLTLSLLALQETAFGAVAGMCARILLDAAVAAGQTTGLSMGLGFGALIDPNSGADSNTLGQLLSVLAMSFAVALGLHREALAWLAASARAVPPGMALDLSTLGEQIIKYTVLSLTVAVRMSYPVMVAVTFGHLGLALAGRVAPQFNLSSVGFSVAILAGGGALFLVAPAAAQFAAQTAVNSFTGR